MPKSDYADLVAQAEQAVKSVTNAELKRVAFEKILDDLLKGLRQSSAPQVAAKVVERREPHTKTKATARRGPQQYIEDMILDAFFKTPKTIADVKAELENRGHHIPLTSLSGPLQKLVQRRMLRRQRGKIEGKRQGFVYAEW